ncbi:hypothetical protein [Pseudonocardia phyllosphaerae]|uniref:hypothetical protein n=1 Tax=Pseudonocardia phyllosphaerae TaxID=3390502 RepID=UPI003979B9D4
MRPSGPYSAVTPERSARSGGRHAASEPDEPGGPRHPARPPWNHPEPARHDPAPHETHSAPRSEPAAHDGEPFEPPTTWLPAAGERRRRAAAHAAGDRPDDAGELGDHREHPTEYLPVVGPGEQPAPPAAEQGAEATARIAPHDAGPAPQDGPATRHLDGPQDPGGPGTTGTDGPGDEHPKNGGIGDGVALSLCSAFGSVAGLLVVLISTRIMPQADVGRASEFVSAMQLIGGAAQLNLGIGLMRWLPGAGRKSVRLVFGSLLLIMPLSGLMGLIYGTLVPSIIETAGGGNVTWGMVLFVLACAGWGVFVVHDFAMVAVGRPWIAVWRNGTFAVVRLALLVALGVSLKAEGFILSWAVPVVVWVAAGTVVLWFMVRRFAASGGPGVLPARSTMIAFLLPTALAQTGNAALYNQVPLLANLRMGNEIGATFFIIWQAVTVVDLAATFFTNSLAVQTAREPHRSEELARATRRRMLMLFVPILALGALLGYPVLAVLGSGYTVGAPALAVLMLGLLFRLIVVFELARRQADGDGMGYAKLQLVNTGLVVGFAFVVPLPDPAHTSAGLVMLPFVLGYLGAQIICALALRFLPAWKRRPTSEVTS